MVPAKPFPLVARIVTGNRPAAVGVPEMTPAVLRVTPAGRDPDASTNVAGPSPPVA